MRITTSRRNEHWDREQIDGNSNLMEGALATLGAMATLCGYILLFIGLRGLHWSVTIAQLGATLLMTASRAWVRRGLQNFPACKVFPMGSS
jgi:hypothetical protein